MDTVKSLLVTFPDDILFEVLVNSDMETVATLCQSCKRLLANVNRPEALKVFAERSGLPYSKTFAELSGLFETTKSNYGRDTMIKQAARDGDVRVVDATLKLCNRASSLTEAALIAAENESIGVVEVSLANGDVVKCCTKFSKFPLIDTIFAAAENGRVGVIELFLVNGATANDKMRGMGHASSYGHINIVELLLANNPTMYGKNNSMSLASGRGHLDIVKLLLANGANDMDSSMISAAGRGHLDIVKLLLANGATSNRGTIESAAAYGHISVVKLLLENGADPDNNAMTYAASKGHMSVVELLLTYNYDCNSAMVHASK